MNSVPDTLPMRFLRGETPYQGATGDLSDAWKTMNPKDPGFTDPSSGPQDRIDYIYVIPGPTGAPKVQSCRLVLDKPVNGIYASDHIGVLCTFEVP
jgi:endonuclease/exonuclease/phosphatase family metal-dependent hydrolase